MLRAGPIVVLSAGILAAQGTAPREKPDAYPVHAALGEYTLAAEYLVHSIPAQGGNFVAEDYLVIEVGLFGPKLGQPKVSTEQFTLRMNGSKGVLMTQSSGMVAGSIKYPDWSTRPNLTLGGGIGNAGVVLGQPAPVGRFPGDPTVTTRRVPVPQTTPSGQQPQEESPQVPLEEQIQRVSLPEGVRPVPISGLIYFPFKGKMKSIKNLDLLYDGPLGKATLKLF